MNYSMSECNSHFFKKKKTVILLSETEESEYWKKYKTYKISTLCTYV